MSLRPKKGHVALSILGVHTPTVTPGTPHIDWGLSQARPPVDPRATTDVLSIHNQYTLLRMLGYKLITSIYTDLHGGERVSHGLDTLYESGL